MGDNLKTRILSALTGQSRELEDRIKALTIGQVEILSVQAELKNGLHAMTAGQDRLRTDVIERIGRLQDAITKIWDDIAVNLGNTEKGDVVASKERQIRRLQADVHALKGEAP